jgi:putative phosphoesterase
MQVAEELWIYAIEDGVKVHESGRTGLSVLENEQARRFVTARTACISLSAGTSATRATRSTLRVAFLSDIHANLPALQNALADAERRGAGAFVVAGDVVGDGPHPVEVIGVLRERKIPAIRGNVDRKVLDVDKTALLRQLIGVAEQRQHAWTARQLGPTEREWLEALPAELSLEYGGVSVRVVHGSPRGDTDYVYPSITGRGLRSKLGEDRPQVLVCGHSHIPFTRRITGVRVINCGSVGRPADGDSRGSYALADLVEGRAPRARIVRFAYPVASLVRALKERGVPGAEPEQYRRGVKR